MGSLAKGFLRKVCGNSAESSRKLRFIAPGKGAEILRKFSGNLRNMFCNDPFPNDPISELLKYFLGIWKSFDSKFHPHFSHQRLHIANQKKTSKCTSQRTLAYCCQYGVRFCSVLLLCSEFARNLGFTTENIANQYKCSDALHSQ